MNAETTRERIRTAIRRRLAAGETRQAIAQSLGVNTTTVWRWEVGQVQDSTCALIELVASPLHAQAAV
jgi:DNA-binding XRE family transcriptional regulator